MSTKRHGIHRDVLAEEYLEWSTLSLSELRLLVLPEPRPQTEAMRFGTECDALWFDEEEMPA